MAALFFFQILGNMNTLNLRTNTSLVSLTANPQRYLVRLPASLKSQIAAFLPAVCCELKRTQSRLFPPQA